MKLRNLAVIASILTASAAYPAGAKYAGEFLATGIGARALGMGGAFVSVADDASASYWNPAGMIFVQRREIVMMHSERFGDLVNYDAGSFVQQLGRDNSKRSAFGFSFLRVGVDDIYYTRKTTDNAGVERVSIDRTVSQSDWGFFFSYAKLMSRTLSLGGNVKVIRKSVGDDSALGFGFDVAALYKPWRRLSIGANLQDATTTFLIWNSETESILPTAKLGVSYPFLFPAVRGKLTLAAGLDTRFEGRKYATRYWIGEASADVRLGLEYWYDDLVAVRVGQEQHAENDYMAGAGLRLPFSGNTLGLDYAFLSNGHDLDDTHRVSGSFIF